MKGKLKLVERRRCWWHGEEMAWGRIGNTRTRNNGIDRTETILRYRFHH